MNLITKINSTFNEYKNYKEKNRNNYLTSKSHKSKNFFNFLRLKKFMSKYSKLLYKHFLIPEDFETYDFLLNYFGKTTLEKALQNQNASTQDIAKILFKDRDFNNFFEESKSMPNIVSVSYSISFAQTIGLNISDINLGIKPQYFTRPSYNKKSMLDIFYENNVTPDLLKKLYDIYGKEIINEYYNDDFLRNKSILSTDSNSSNITLEDHITHYSPEKLDTIFQKYFNEEKLSKVEQAIVIGLLAKECDLIYAYTIPHLLNNPEYIKSEIKIGIFNDIVVKNKHYSNAERKLFATLAKDWNKEDLENYNNLSLLKNRLLTLSNNPKLSSLIQHIDKILALPLSELPNHSKEIAKFMNSAYTDYEISNRENIITKLYDPPNEEEIIISDISQMSSAAMLHFFDPKRQVFTFEEYVKDLEFAQSQKLGKDFHFSEEELKKLHFQYELSENHYLPSYSINADCIAQAGTYESMYITNTSNQQSAMITTARNIAKGYGTRGTIALGFSKATLTPDLIATVSDHNIHSNKGIDYVESTNQFKDFSSSYEELASPSNHSISNNEVVLFRNTFESALKPSYVFYIPTSLNNDSEKNNIKAIKEQMKKANLNIPLVIFDKEKINQQLIDQNKRLLHSQENNVSRDEK